MRVSRPLSAFLILLLGGSFLPAQVELTAQTQAPVAVNPPTIKVTTQIVAVNMLAVGSDGEAVEGLTANDFTVFEAAAKSPKVAQTIAAFRALPRSYGAIALSELLSLPHRSRCWVDAVPSHYLLAYYPNIRQEGVHHIYIKVRHGVRLVYRNSYVMTGAGTPAPPPGDLAKLKKEPEPDLMEAACGSAHLSSMRLITAFAIPTDAYGDLLYFLALNPIELSFQRQSKDEYQLGTDYAVCASNRAHKRLYYTQGTLDDLLTADDYQSVRESGYPFFLKVKGAPGLASVRVLFRDSKTQKMSAIVLSYTQSSAGKPLLQQMQAAIGPNESSVRVPGVVGMFGTTAPTSLSLCGDVYELPPGTPHLTEFAELNSIGAIYATALAVPDLFIGGVYGEASTMPSFGINYRGTFWITQPGEYLFSLTSDDGANLYIDDRLIIDNDGIHSAKTIEGGADLTAGEHTIRVKYMQTMPTNLALSLRVKRPNQSKWQLFDTRSFAP